MVVDIYKGLLKGQVSIANIDLLLLVNMTPTKRLPVVNRHSFTFTGLIENFPCTLDHDAPITVKKKAIEIARENK